MQRQLRVIPAPGPVERRPFMPKPTFVASKKLPKSEQMKQQLAAFEECLADTPLMELKVSEWYELSSLFRGLSLLLTRKYCQAVWQQCAEYRRGQLDESEMSPAGRAFHCFEFHRKKNWNKWARETGYHTRVWRRTKGDPKKHAERKASNLAAQHRRRARRRGQDPECCAEAAE